MAETTYEWLLASLANLRADLGKAREEEQKLLDTLATDPIYTRYLEVRDEIKQLRTNSVEIESDFRKAALDRFAINQEKKTPAYTIRMTTHVSYEEEPAVKWCIEHFPQALTVKERDLSRVVKVMKPDFANVKTIPTVAITKDLSPYVAELPQAENDETIPF